jgi:hypothetical protein
VALQRLFVQKYDITLLLQYGFADADINQRYCVHSQYVQRNAATKCVWTEMSGDKMLISHRFLLRFATECYGL